jgi:hypothetical protein
VSETALHPVPGARWLALAACLLAAGCGASPSSTAPSATSSSGPTGSWPPAASVGAPSPTPAPTPDASPTRSAQPAQPSAPPGTAFVPIADAGILLPVPLGWRMLTAAQLADPATRADLAATYPGMRTMLAAIDEVSARASPAFLAVDPAGARKGGPMAANLSVLTSQPSVGGPLLDFAAGFICDGLAQFIGAGAKPAREHHQLPVGDGVRCAYDVPAGNGGSITAVAWVIGAPSGTLLVTLAGPASTLGQVTADEIARSIVTLPRQAP